VTQFHYHKVKTIISEAVVMDGYGKVPQFDGPFRDVNNKVVYYDPTKGSFLDAVKIHKSLK
jgi:hypothetical protein